MTTTLNPEVTSALLAEVKKRGLKVVLHEVRRALIDAAVTEAKGHMTNAADLLRMDRAGMYRLIWGKKSKPSKRSMADLLDEVNTKDDGFWGGTP